MREQAASTYKALQSTRGSADKHSTHIMPFGAALQTNGAVLFRVWAPEAVTLHLELEGSPALLQMISDDQGWHELIAPEARVGSRYRFVLPSGLRVPDPASRFQPDDVNGPSEVIDPAAYTWRTLDWNGCAWEQAVLYELHIGAFTREGTFRAAIEKLDHLVRLGVTAIEIMPVTDFPGNRNWGYDGVLLYAPDSSYGRPEDLKALVDAAHERRMMVILDVVYNHFGPEGNYIAQYYPDIVTDEYTTPWGQALNFDSRHSEKTRKFIVHNALYWIEEFRMDGLRLDAVHAMIDSSSTHILDEIARTVRSIAGGRPIHLILESDDRVLHHLRRDEFARPLSSTAQWNHDMQKLAAVALTRNRSEGQDRKDTALLGKALIEGFTSGPQHRNTPTSPIELSIGPGGFISFIQTHDVVGNRIAGERITHLAAREVVRAIACVYLLAPQIPMLFMGEEWAASSPFPYFCDFKGDLADAVRKGRLEQFASQQQREDAEFLAGVPDPLAEETFVSAKLNWEEQRASPHKEWLDWYTRILRMRHESIVPLLHRLHEVRGEYELLGPRQLCVRWKLDDVEIRLDANLSPASSDLFGHPCRQTVWLEGTTPGTHELGPWSVRWSLATQS
jgi:malto-oligosyltrehalose trehalohydrolase